MWRCRDFPGALPYAGGLLDQPAGLIARMITAYNVWQAVKDWRSSKDWIEWSMRNPGRWATVQAVITYREQETLGTLDAPARDPLEGQRQGQIEGQIFDRRSVPGARKRGEFRGFGSGSTIPVQFRTVGK